MNVNKVVLNHVKATLPANQNGAGSGSVGSVSNPSGDTSIFTANPSGAGKLHGQSNAVNGAYKAVATLRQSSRANRSLGVGEYPGGGTVIEKISIGSFANKGDNRTELCHFRTRPERKQNSSFSFDPKTLLCSNCPSRGGHRIDGGGEERQTFILSDQNFPGVLPCSSGECLKIVRVENGSLNEIVTCFLEVTRGEGLPTGSAILLFSASHLQMRGVGGYMFDMADEMGRLNAIFRGGVVCVPGVPILLGGCEDKTLIRSLIEAGKWLTWSGTQFLKETWEIFAKTLLESEKGGYYETEVFRHTVPENLSSCQSQCSWISGGWASPRGAHPATIQIETAIIKSLTLELNSLFGLELCTEPIHDRLTPTVVSGTKKALVIGASHALREGNALSERGYDVITCAVGGWRPNKTACENMADCVKEALTMLSPTDIVVIHCFDNVAFMARSEEGGDLPIRRYCDGEYHIEGELVVASKERLYMFFRNCLPVFNLLEGRVVFFLTPMPRYLYVNCCVRADHAPNRLEDSFEENIRKSLAD